MIDPATIARIKDTAQIYDVVSEFVTLRKRGANYWGVCPFHNEKTPSFSVSPAKGIFKCFGCGEGGDSAHFIMKHENISYGDALRFLAKKYHIEIAEREETSEEIQQQKDRESMFAANEFAAKFFENTLHNHADGQALALSYLRERGFNDDIIRKFRIGFALDTWSELADAAQKQGYNLDFFEKVGLCRRNETTGNLYDFFRGRIIFPWFTLSGKVVAFTGRVLSRETKGVSQKYLNTGETPIFVKSNEIFGIFQAKNAITKADCVYMVEGQTDVISMHQCGVENVVACSGGNGLSKTQAHTLHRFTSNIILMYDNDTAGEKDTDAAIAVALTEGMNVSVVRLPEGEDPDSFARTHNANAFIDYIAAHKTDFATYICRKILKKSQNNPAKKVQMIVDELIPAIASIYNNNILTAEYIKLCASLLDLNEEAIYVEIDKLRHKRKKAAEQRQQTGNEETATDEKRPQNAENIVTADNKMQLLEKDILKYALLYGKEPIFTDENGHEWTVDEFIVNQLIEADEIQFTNPLHQTMLYELAAHHLDIGFDPAHFFAQHANQEISRLAADLLTDKYTLSKLFTDTGNAPKVEGRTEKERASAQERLDKYNQKRREERRQATCDNLSKVIIEYKNSLIIKHIEQAMLELKNASENGDTAGTEQAMAKIARLNAQKAEAARMLGERVIVKIG